MTISEKLAFFREHPVTDWHEHTGLDLVEACNDRDTRVDQLIAAADIAGIDRIVISMPITGGAHASPEEIEAANDYIAYCCRRHPGRLWGLAYVDAIHGRYAADEINRCRREHGFIGVKLYNQFFLSDDIQKPIIECCIANDMPILMHAGHAGHPGSIISQPFISDSTHFCKAAEKYPDATFILAHPNGGGDWYWQLKGIARYPNIFCDTSGSVLDGDTVKKFVDTIGAERVLFGTDGSFCSSIGRLLDSGLTEDQLLTIMDNPAFARYLK